MSYFPQINSTTSTVNSTTTLLTDGSTFTGTGETNDFQDVMTVIATDQNGTIYFDFSSDGGANWDSTISFEYNTERINPPHVLVKAERTFRIRFLNDSGADQTYLRLTTYFGLFNKLTSSINAVVSENYDATITRPTLYKYEVAMNKRQGRYTVNKWGYNLDIDTAASEIVASFGGVFDPNTNIITTAQTFTITYDNSTDGLGQTGATQLFITYLDANYIEQTAVHVLGSTGSDVTAFNGLGINRALVLANGGVGWNVNDITLTATTDATIQARIPELTSVTQQCIFHTQINHSLMIDFISLNALKISGGGASPEVNVRMYSWSRVTNTRYEVFNHEIDTNISGETQPPFSQPFIFGGREVVWIEASTDTNNTKLSARMSGIQERTN